MKWMLLLIVTLTLKNDLVNSLPVAQVYGDPGEQTVYLPQLSSPFYTVGTGVVGHPVEYQVDSSTPIEGSNADKTGYTPSTPESGPHGYTSLVEGGLSDPSAYSPSDPNVYSPSDPIESQVDPTGYSPSSPVESDPSGYSPSGPVESDPSGYSPSEPTESDPHGPTSFTPTSPLESDSHDTSEYSPSGPIESSSPDSGYLSGPVDVDPNDESGYISSGPYPYDSENEIFSSQSYSKDEMADVFRALDLPADFASGPHPTEQSELVTSASSPQLYMTGNPKLDRIMNCPCKHSQLEELGVTGHAYHATSSYGPHVSDFFEHYGTYGTTIVKEPTKLAHAGDSTGSVFGSLLKLVLQIPSLKLSVLQPLLSGISGTAAHATGGVANLSAHVAKSLPTMASTKADIVKRLIETAGSSGGSILSIISQLISSAASAQQSFTSERLPKVFETLGQKSERVVDTVETIASGLSGTGQIITTGAKDVAQAKGKIVSALVEGGHDFKSGVLEGIKNVVSEVKQIRAQSSPSLYTSLSGIGH